MSENTDRYETAVARYFEAWNAGGPDTLTKAVAAAWTPDCTFTDPFTDARGHEQVAAMIASVHERFPGFTVRPLGTVDGHHDTARFGWEMVAEADGSAPVAGFDVIVLDDEGRIRSVYGFLDRVPA
ncbi:nuclear transport factor 2 family protein [Streptomyces sp. NPDC058751]|uniref:nuclear transport factor 2 family protein n=1 Tax=Streptomyces sp. NPDC058751 TaxID=3346623 RepID=UPI0036A7053C